MGQIRAKLNTEITLAQVLRDLQRESGDSEREAMRLLADLVLNFEFGKYRIPIYYKTRITIRSKRTDTGKEVDASISRKAAVGLAPLETRLREAALDGWTARTRQLYVGGQPVPVADITFEKGSLIAALEAERISIPKNWSGSESPAERRCRLALRKKELLAQGKRNFLSIIAKEERISTERAGALIRAAK